MDASRVAISAAAVGWLTEHTGALGGSWACRGVRVQEQQQWRAARRRGRARGRRCSLLTHRLEGRALDLRRLQGAQSYDHDGRRHSRQDHDACGGAGATGGGGVSGMAHHSSLLGQSTWGQEPCNKGRPAPLWAQGLCSPDEPPRGPLAAAAADVGLSMKGLLWSGAPGRGGGVR